MADIISSHYSQLQGLCRDNERIISKVRTDEDWLQDSCLTALKVYGNKEITEEEGLNYLIKTVKQAISFKWKKIDNTVVLLGDIEYKNL